uniref:Uncharacterized protein n=1 Tax=Amorphochlora amoebiformis TaxID=1561963 RepID=A0A7S0GQI7_9EUKA
MYRYGEHMWRSHIFGYRTDTAGAISSDRSQAPSSTARPSVFRGGSEFRRLRFVLVFLGAVPFFRARLRTGLDLVSVSLIKAAASSRICAIPSVADIAGSMPRVTYSVASGDGTLRR